MTAVNFKGSLISDLAVRQEQVKFFGDKGFNIGLSPRSKQHVPTKFNVSFPRVYI